AFETVTDPMTVLLALRWLIDEMERRYKTFARVGVRNIISFIARPRKKEDVDLDEDAVAAVVDPGLASAAPATKESVQIPDKIPYIVVIIDELADLMQTAPADVESAIARITQMARAAGIHIVVATQTPRADVITGVIKANIPSRIAFQVASKIDSRVILDENGADRLLGQGDMLYLPPSTSRLIRAQGVLVTDDEIRELVDFVSKQGAPAFDTSMEEKLQSGAAQEEKVTEEDEELVEKCLEIIRQEKRASTSLLRPTSTLLKHRGTSLSTATLICRTRRRPNRLARELPGGTKTLDLRSCHSCSESRFWLPGSGSSASSRIYSESLRDRPKQLP